MNTCRQVNPSGRLPITFPEGIEQTPHPTLAGYAFGHGLSYTIFSYGDLEVAGGETVTATNAGVGQDVHVTPGSSSSHRTISFLEGLDVYPLPCRRFV